MGKKILIVDDEYHITRSLAFLFQKEGYDPLVAYDGPGAIEQMKKRKPNLIFLDVDIPGKNGYEIAQEVRNSPVWKEIPILMLSAKGQEIDRQKGIESGADEYILKPFDPRAILAKVRTIIG